MTMTPAVVPRAYATQRAQKVAVRSITAVGTSRPRVAAAPVVGGTQPAGRKPAGGFFSRYAPIIVIPRNRTEKIWQVVRQPTSLMSLTAMGPKTPEPAP